MRRHEACGGATRVLLRPGRSARFWPPPPPARPAARRRLRTTPAPRERLRPLRRRLRWRPCLRRLRGRRVRRPGPTAPATGGRPNGPGRRSPGRVRRRGDRSVPTGARGTIERTTRRGRARQVVLARRGSSRAPNSSREVRGRPSGASSTRPSRPCHQRSAAKNPSLAAPRESVRRARSFTTFVSTIVRRLIRAAMRRAHQSALLQKPSGSRIVPGDRTIFPPFVRPVKSPTCTIQCTTFDVG